MEDVSIIITFFAIDARCHFPREKYPLHSPFLIILLRINVPIMGSQHASKVHRDAENSLEGPSRFHKKMVFS